MLGIPALEKLLHELSQLPGVGPKTAQRLVHHILKKPTYSQELREALSDVEGTIGFCKQCFSYTEKINPICQYCSNPKRRDDLVCVVEEPENISQIDGSGAFDGRYHVLHGVISPLDGRSPEDLKIRELLERIDRQLDLDPKSEVEVIMALDSDLEGDTTMLYLAKVLGLKDRVRVSRLAQGVPIGSHLDYVDQRTLSRALENRVTL